MKAYITKIVENYEFTGIMVWNTAASEYLNTGYFTGEIVCENEDGSMHLAAKCIVEGCPSDMLSILDSVVKEDLGYIIYPIDIFEIDYNRYI